MSEYCDQTNHIIDAVYSNPENYTYKDRELLMDHVEKCTVCYEFFLNYNTTEDIK